MTMTISGVRANVQTLLEDSELFTTVLNHPPSDATKFAGFPAAAHYYANTESNYATVSQNRRIFEYIVELYLVTDSATTESTKYTEIYSLIDSAMQLFDESIDLSVSGVGPACDIMRPTPSDLQLAVLPEGPGFVATLRLFCESDVTFRNS